MLAGEAAAELDAHFENGRARFLGFDPLLIVVDVVEDQRMHVAVAGVKDIGDPKPERGANLAGALKRLRQLAGRHRAVHADIIGDPAGRPERRLAPFPDLGALHRRHRFAHGAHIVRFGDRADPGQHRPYLGVRALDLDDQHRLDIERIAGVGEILADVDRRLVHVLHRHRNDAGADDRGDALARVLDRIEAEQNRARPFRQRNEAHDRLGHDAQLALGAADEAEEVVAGRVHRLAADIEDLAVQGDEARAEEIVGGDAVLEAVGAA